LSQTFRKVIIFYFKMYFMPEILFAKFGFSDLHSIPTDSHLMPILRMPGVFAQNPPMFTHCCSFKQTCTFKFAVCGLWMIKLCLTMGYCTDRCSVRSANIYGTVPSVSGSRHVSYPVTFYLSYLMYKSDSSGCTPQSVQLLANASV
jgi:hypothetical protein